MTASVCVMVHRQICFLPTRSLLQVNPLFDVALLCSVVSLLLIVGVWLRLMDHHPTLTTSSPSNPNSDLPSLAMGCTASVNVDEGRWRSHHHHERNHGARSTNHHAAALALARASGRTPLPQSQQVAPSEAADVSSIALCVGSKGEWCTRAASGDVVELLPRFVAQGEACDVDCSICLSSLQQTTVVVLPCLHKFHANCANAWLAKSDTCPECRTMISSDNLLWASPLSASPPSR